MKKIILRVGAITGIIAFILFCSIAFSSNIPKIAPYNIIGALCFFMFLLVGIPCITMIFDPDALVHVEHESNKNIKK